MNLGAILIWCSWLYIIIAILMAKTTYRRALKANPAYFESDDYGRLDPFKESRGVFELITDDSLQSDDFGPSIEKMIRLVKFMYFSAPIAFVIFIYGIFIR